MDLHKIIGIDGKYHILELTYNPNRWCGKQWKYLYVTDAYPSEHVRYAKIFDTMKEANEWVEWAERNSL
jgi:hypothetical protein